VSFSGIKYCISNQASITPYPHIWLMIQIYMPEKYLNSPKAIAMLLSARRIGYLGQWRVLAQIANLESPVEPVSKGDKIVDSIESLDKILFSSQLLKEMLIAQ